MWVGWPSTRRTIEGSTVWMGRLKRGTRSDCAFASEYIHFYDARPRKEG